ncbi:glycogen/starch synthase [Desulfobacterota bacterium M19]
MIDKACKNIWFVSREYDSLTDGGEVHHLVSQLASALARSGLDVSVVLPRYGFMEPEDAGFSRLELSFTVDMSYVRQERREPVKIWHKKNAVDIYLIDSPRLREKKGLYSYTAAEAEKMAGIRQDDRHVDYFAMNILLQKAAVCLMICLDQDVDIIHCHNAHTALLPALINENEGFRHYFVKTGCLVSIYNAAADSHQGVADLPFAQVISGLPARVIHRNILNNQFDPLLAAADYAVMNTVTESYARQLTETDEDELSGWLGHTLMGRGVRLIGAANAVSRDDNETESGAGEYVWSKLKKSYLDLYLKALAVNYS